MKSIELLKILQKINKPFYTIADLEKITGFSRASLYVALKRWVNGGIIERVAQGIYLPMGSSIPIENVATQLYIPNYLSFESALAKYDILNLIPYTITFATTRKTRNYTVRNQEIEFRQIAQELFFGFEMRDGIYIASPEKAFLDELYFVVRGKATLDFDEIDLRKLSIKTLKTYSKRFPAYVRKYFERIGRRGDTGKSRGGANCGK
jgi:predicted transcriptional regulator of viral defense system